MRIALIVLLVIVLSSVAAHSIEIRGDWVQIQVGDVAVFTNDDDDKAIQFARKINLLKRTLRAFAMVEPGWERPLRLYVFKDLESYGPYTVSSKKAAGFTAAGESSVSIAMLGMYGVNRKGRANYAAPAELMAHEYVHAFLAEYAPRIPLWLNEGLAEFFRTYRVDDDHVYIGAPIEYYQLLLKQQGQYMTTARLITRTGEDEEYHGGMNTGLFYAQSWANTHYLMTQKERRQGLNSFLRDIHDGVPELTAFSRDLEERFARQGGQLRNYVTQHKVPTFKLKRKDNPDDQTVTRTKLDRATTLVRLGELMVGMGAAKAPDAQAHFEACLQEEPHNIDAQIGLARLAFHRGDTESVREYLNPVLVSDPANLRAKGMLGYAMIRQHDELLGDDAWAPGAELPEDVQQARKYLRAAMVAEVPEPGWFFAYAVSFGGAEDPAPGVEALEAVIAAAPWYAGSFDLLVRLHCSAGQLERARDVFDRELRGRELPTERYETEMLLVSAEVERSEQLFQSGAADEAAVLLITALTPTDFGVVREFIRRQLTRIQIDLVYQRYVEVLEFEHAGDYARALEDLDVLMPELDGSALTELAQELREHLVAVGKAGA